MRTRTTAALIAAVVLAAPAAEGQDLPPPPPPPIGQPTELPPATPARPAPPPPPRYEPVAPPPPYGHPRRRRETIYVYEEPVARPVAVTLNPAALVLGRLSANVEVLLAPHHSLVLSPNLLVFQEGHGGRYDLASEGLGFATQRSSGFGAELGYHYWWHWRRSLVGPYFGPSLLLGSVTNASVGPTASAQGYWGGAFDAGGQGVLPGGFTMGAGVGLGFVEMASVAAVFPRFLFQLGWSF
ncbi:MAG TPA: hypothetical protein VGL81_22685 [Polyangiaceae bacterium]|jgi:hypothetical protein